VITPQVIVSPAQQSQGLAQLSQLDHQLQQQIQQQLQQQQMLQRQQQEELQKLQQEQLQRQEQQKQEEFRRFEQQKLLFEQEQLQQAEQRRLERQQKEEQELQQAEQRRLERQQKEEQEQLQQAEQRRLERQQKEEQELRQAEQRRLERQQKEEQEQLQQAEQKRLEKQRTEEMQNSILYAQFAEVAPAQPQEMPPSQAPEVEAQNVGLELLQEDELPQAQVVADQPVTVYFPRELEASFELVSSPSAVSAQNSLELPPLMISLPLVESNQPSVSLVGAPTQPLSAEADLESLATRPQQFGQPESSPVSEVVELKASPEVPVVASGDQFVTELDHLEQLGFTDRQFNLMLLNYNKGKLLPIITFLNSA
jgi:hypothetical protein